MFRQVLRSLTVQNSLRIAISVATVGLLIVAVTSVIQVNQLSGEINELVIGIDNVQKTMSQISVSSIAASDRANQSSEAMNTQLVSGLRLSAADMNQLQRSIADIVENFNFIIEEGESDPDMLLIEIEDVYETLRRESLPRLDSVGASLDQVVSLGEAQSQDIMSLATTTATFVELASNSNASVGTQLQNAEIALARAQASRNVLVVITIFFLMLVSGLLYVISRAIRAPLKLLTDRVKDIAEGEGDLTKRINYSRADEFGALAVFLNVFLEKLQRSVKEVKDWSDDINALTEQVRSESKTSAKLISAQQGETQQVAVAVGQMDSTVGQVAEHTSQAAKAASETSKTAASGENVVTKVIGTIDTLAKDVDDAAQEIDVLAADSEAMRNIVNNIQSIAEQTNLLALNAAIEAARAGEQGRGFAVVADEVRSLASRTQEATVQIQDMISRLQSRTNAVVGVIRTSHESAKEAVALAAGAGESLGQITARIGAIDEMNAQIAVSSEDQSQVTRKLNSNLIDISSKASSAAQSSATIMNQASSLADMVQKLKLAVAQFKV